MGARVSEVRESKIERYFKRRVEETGGEVRKAKWVGRKHAPDRYAFWPITPVIGRFSPRSTGGARAGTPRAVWVELKRPGGDARDGQRREHVRMHMAGLDVRVADTEEKVDAIIKEYGLSPVELAILEKS